MIESTLRIGYETIDGPNGRSIVNNGIENDRFSDSHYNLLREDLHKIFEELVASYEEMGCKKQSIELNVKFRAQIELWNGNKNNVRYFEWKYKGKKV